jgi:uncharacterized cupin superfamily protein
MSRPTHIVHRNDVAPVERSHGEKFAFKGRQLGVAAGSQKLGCTLYQIQPGKTGFPAHVHYANEEAIYILSGTGSLRLGSERHPVGAGDYVAMPAGGPAHQLFNTGTAPLEYLCFSTLISPEVVEYPDSNKVMARVGGPPTPVLREIYRKGSGVDYYEGE